MRPYRRRRPGGSIRPHLAVVLLLLGVLIPLVLLAAGIFITIRRRRK